MLIGMEDFIYSIPRQFHDKINLAHALAEFLMVKDKKTYVHSQNVADLCLKLCDRLNLETKRKIDIYVAALLHDIGKIGIEDAILRNPGDLTDDEYLNIKKHPIVGQHLVCRFPGMEDTGRIIRHHHEKYDGSGYPDHLTGNEIPYESRMIAVSDAYHSMVERSYSKYRDKFSALSEIRKKTGTQFDTEIAESFIESSEIFR